MLPPTKWILNLSTPLDDIIFLEGPQTIKICNDVNSKSKVILDIGKRIELLPGDCHNVHTSKFTLELHDSSINTAFGTYQIIS